MSKKKFNSDKNFSSVEWLYHKMVIKICNKLQTMEYTHLFLEELEQAKVMRKNELENAYYLGYGDHQNMGHHTLDELFDYVLIDNKLSNDNIQE